MSRDNGKPYWHWQNLTKEENKGKFPWHGRGWLRFNSELKESNRERWWDYKETLNVEWNIGRLRLRLDFGAQADSEQTVSFAFGLGFAGIHLHLDSLRLSRWIASVTKNRSYERKFSFYWFESALWLQLWGSEFESSRSDPWWRKMHAFRFDDFFLGQTDYSKVELWSKPVSFEMDGKKYLCKATGEKCTWKRPRWFADVREYIDISFNADMCHPPQFAGKGENSWDCGDEGIWGTSFQTNNVEDAIEQYKQCVIGYRKRYGNPSKV